MSAERNITPRFYRLRRPARLTAKARAQGFAGLDDKADGFAAVLPGRTFAFPADHGPHPEFRVKSGGM